MYSKEHASGYITLTELTNGERHMATSIESRRLAYLRAHQRETAERIAYERTEFMRELGLVQYTPWGV
jgi:hypothetical protein